MQKDLDPEDWSNNRTLFVASRLYSHCPSEHLLATSIHTLQRYMNYLRSFEDKSGPNVVAKASLIDAAEQLARRTDSKMPRTADAEGSSFWSN